ncbi:MAG: hypothetical protein QOF51_344 [Chloroflexota bacterium]|nr:hypothetical protein [Chloroflexota bacterium]
MTGSQPSPAFSVNRHSRRGPWHALFYKAWFETRSRFLTGLIVVIAICAFMTLLHPYKIAMWKRDLIQHPEWKDPIWSFAVHTNYATYLWHYLYQDMLQKVFLILAVLLGIGGLGREASHGTAGLTLALPVSRKTLLASRAAVGAIEVGLLGFVAFLTIVVCSRAIRIDYSLTHGLLHAGLIVAGGLVGFAAGLLISATVEGEHAPTLVALSIVGMLFYVMAPYSDGVPTSLLVGALNLVGVMSGGSGSGLADVPWTGLAVSLTIASLSVYYAFYRSTSRDY